MPPNLVSLEAAYPNLEAVFHSLAVEVSVVAERKTPRRAVLDVEALLLAVGEAVEEVRVRITAPGRA